MTDMDNDEEDVLIEECEICGGDILIDSYSEEDDVVYCNDCEAEYYIKSTDPVRLKLLDDDNDADSGDTDDSYGEDYD